MKGSIVIAGRDYDSRKFVQEQFDVDYTTIGKWVKNGLLPTPLRLGNRLYFDRTAVAIRILATAR
jgi:predicted site-specific integrase-resolvase